MISGDHEHRFPPDWPMGYLRIEHEDAVVWRKKKCG